MCGIVGFTGTQNAAPILLDGLKKLEYRGYDSAGIAVVSKDCGLQIECKVVSKQMLSGEFMDKDVHDRCYPADDYHMLYFGEVVACYTTDEE